MNIETVVNALQATTSNDNTVRKNAESALHEMTLAPGFFPCLLTILGEQNMPHSVRISAAIALKNRLRNRYNNDKEELINAADKDFLRNNIIPIMCNQQDKNTTSLLGVAIEEIASKDFPGCWNCVDQIDSFLNSPNPQIIYNAVFVVRSIMHSYQYRANKQGLYELTKHFYPILLQCAGVCVQSIKNELSQQLLHLIIKTYYTSLDLTSENVSYFQVNDFATWIPFLCELLQLPITNPDNNNPDVSIQEKSLFPEWHIKKWSIVTIHRISCNILAMKDHKNPDYIQWVNEYAPTITNLVLNLLNDYVAAPYYYNKVVIKYFSYLKAMIDIGKLYKLIKSQIEHIINHVLPKAMTITPEEQELWVDDPVRFVNQVYDMYYEYTNVRNEAGEFIMYLSKVRANDILLPFLDFLTSSFNQYRSMEASQVNYMNKEWMLYALELLAKNLLSKDNLRQNVENVLVEYVFPEFKSPSGFLRARACRVYAAFKKLDMNNEHLCQVVQNMLLCLNDHDFPVCVTAAISLQSFLDTEERMNLIRPSLQQVVERFVYLLQQVVVEEIMQTFDLIINRFEADLLPMSASILNVLINAFNNYKKDEDNDSAIFTAMSTIECICSIVTSAVTSPEYYDQAAQLVIPCIMNVITNNEADYYEACFTSLRFFVHYFKNANTTRELIWNCYPLVVLTVEQSAMDYVSNFFGVVDSYLNADINQMVNRTYQGKSYLSMLFDFVNDCLFDDEMEAVEEGYSVGILMIIIHYCYGQMDTVLEPCIQIVQKFIEKMEAKIDELLRSNEEDESIRDYYMELDRNCIARSLMVIESAFIIHPDVTLNYLVSINWADRYMMLVLTYLDSHDSLLANRILGMSLATVFTLPFSSLPASYQQEYSNMFQACLTVMNEIVQLRKEGADESLSDVDYDELMDRIQGCNYNQNDWGYGEEDDVEDNLEDSVSLRQLEALGQYDSTFREIDKELINQITGITDMAFIQQAFNKANQLQGDAMASCLNSLGNEEKNFFIEYMQQPTEDVTYF